MLSKNIRIVLAATFMATLIGLIFIPAARAASIPVSPVVDGYGNRLYDIYGNSCVVDGNGYLYVMDGYGRLYTAGAYTCQAYPTYPSGNNSAGGYSAPGYEDKSSEIIHDFYQRQAESLNSTACMPYCD